MKKEISHNTTSLTLLGVLEQQQLKVGEGNSGPVSILFDNGSTNKPGIRYVSSSLKPVGSGWEYSNDGITWTPMTSGSGSVNLTGEPINITPADLADGKATISHNLGCKYPLGIGYDKVPQNITFQDDNTMIVDYGDQPSDFTAVLWFYGSTQAMLVPPPLTEYITPINMTSNTSDADWEVYVESPNAKIEEGSVNAWKACAGSETTASSICSIHSCC